MWQQKGFKHNKNEKYTTQETAYLPQYICKRYFCIFHIIVTIYQRRSYEEIQKSKLK
jgi:hypothetical protein